VYVTPVFEAAATRPKKLFAVTKVAVPLAAVELSVYVFCALKRWTPKVVVFAPVIAPVIFILAFEPLVKVVAPKAALAFVTNPENLLNPAFTYNEYGFVIVTFVPATGIFEI